MPGRLARIDQYPEMKDELAAYLAEGMSQSAIAEEMGVKDRGTIADWAKRSEIQVKVSKIIRERANRILSRTDTKIAAKLDSDKDIPVETLLRIRQTFAGDKVKIDVSNDKSGAMQEIMEAIDENPDLATAFAKMQSADDDAA